MNAKRTEALAAVVRRGRRNWTIKGRGVLFVVFSLGLCLVSPGQKLSSEGNEETKKGKTEKPKQASKEEGDDEGADAGGSERPKLVPEKKLTIEEEYVRQNLEKFLNPTKIKWLEDGRVKLSFNFRECKEEHESIFTPKISKEVNSRIRWALRGEYWYGLRIANEGAAHLNVWFTDDVEAEIEYIGGISSSQKQNVALVFTNKAGNSIGSRFGSQCSTFSAGKLERTSGAFEPIVIDTRTQFGLLVKNGGVEAHRDGKKRSSMEYNKKSFASGRIGFLWSGGIGSFIRELNITGTVDAKKMAEQLRKGSRG